MSEEQHARKTSQSAASSRDWEDATPDEIRDAKIQSLEEGLEHLKQLVVEALEYGSSLKHAAEILDEEWSK